MRQGRVQTRRWAAVAIWAAAIFAVSSVPGSGLPGGFSFQAHFFEYFVLGWLLAYALLPNRPAAQAVLLAVLIASLYAVTDEVHQAFVPLRTPDWRDWLTDTVGALIGASCALLVSRRRSGRPSSDRSRAAAP